MIFGHCFEGRWHDEKSSSAHPLSDYAVKTIMDTTPSDEYTSSNLESAKEATSSNKSTYVHDVCTRCGLTVRGPDVIMA